MKHSRKDYMNIQENISAELSNKIMDTLLSSDLTPEEKVKALRETMNAIPANRIPDDEPVFLVRAKDVLAPAVVRTWIEEAKKRHVSDRMIRQAYALLAELGQWQMNNICATPDLPKEEAVS